MFKKTFIIVLSLIFLISIFSYFTINAQESNESTGLTISSPVVEKTINKGEKVSGTIKLTNESNKDLKITVSKKDFTAENEEGAAKLSDPKANKAFSLGAWVDVTDGFDLKSKELKEVSYTISVPENAEPGGHYGSIVFSPSLLNPTAFEGSSTTITSEIGTLILVSVPGEINYGAKLVEFSTAKKFYTNSSNLVEFITRFQNLSTVHVKPKGTISIKNMFGKNVIVLVVNENEGNALPGSIRKFSNDWEKKYGFGFYKATVNLSYSESKNISSSLIFWIIPWKETLVVIILIALISYILSKLEWKK